MTRRVFKEPLQKINENRMVLDARNKQLTVGMNKHMEKYKSDFSKLITKLDALSPLKTLSRGYSITEKDGKIVKSINDLSKGDIVELKYADGSANAEIK